MSKISFKFPLNKISGKIGDLVFCSGPVREFVRVYVPPDPNRVLSEREKRNRDNFRGAVSLWRSLRVEEKELYKKFAYYATKNKRSGWNMFVEEYLWWLKIYEEEKLNRIFRRFLEYWIYGETKERAWEKAMEEVRSKRS